MFPHQNVNEFTPDGHLRQVDYAGKAAESSNTVVGVVGKSCVVLAALKKEQSRLMVSSSASTVFRIDEGIAAAFSGIAGDARPLATGAQQKAMKMRFEYGESPTVQQIARTMGESMQEATMMSHSRPFGVSVLIGGTCPKPEIVKIAADGGFEGVKAGAIGKRAETALEFLEANYNADALETEAAAVKLAIRALRAVDDFSASDVEVSVLSGTGSNGSCRSMTQDDKQAAIEAL